MSGIDPNGGGALVVPGGGGTIAAADITDATAVGIALVTAANAAAASTAIGAVPASTLTTRGDVFVRGASTIGRLALGAAKRILSSDGTDAVWSTIAALLTDIGDTRGHILRRGASAWEALDAQTANTFLGGDGTDVGVRTAAQVRTSLVIPAVALANYGNGTGGDTAWTGWVYTDGSAPTRTDGVVTGGRLRLTCTAGAAISPAGDPSWTLAIPAALRSRSWRFRARLAAFSNASAASRWVVATGGGYLSIRSDGLVAAGGPDANSATGAIPTGGTGWVEVLYTGGVLTLRYGTGTSSTPPTSWKIGRVYTPAEHTAEPSTILFILAEYGTLAGTLTLEMDHATLGPTEDGGW